MGKTGTVLLGMVLLAACIGASKPELSKQQVYRISDGSHASLSELAPQLKQNRIVIVGEHHSNAEHHRAQVRVVEALVAAGARVAIGLEMFRSDSQQDLDRWVSGDLQAVDFEKIYYDNWTFPWEKYRVIFDYAREQQVPLVGLNVSREITAQVARKGFKSLSDEQRGKLADVTCLVDKDYEEYIRNAFGAHAHGKMNFTYFCEAQLVWDSIMAVNAIDYLKDHPDTIMVLLTGVGHARKGAIPRQISSRSTLPHLVFLPEVAGSITLETLTADDADYLLKFGNH
jgi:uncharacterized iron-regulated protein